REGRGVSWPVTSASSVRSEVELRADLEEATDRDRARVEICRRRARSGVRRVEHVRRVRVDQIDDVERDEGLRAAVSQVLPDPHVSLAQSLVIQLAGFDKVQELDGTTARERTPKVGLEGREYEYLP